MEIVNNRHSFLGIHLNPVRLPSLISAILSAAKERRRLTITYINPNYAVAAWKSPELTHAINEFDIVLADGIGIVVGARVLKVSVPERLGTDRVCLELFRECDNAGFPLRVFLLGGRPGIADKATKNLEAAFPSVTVVGRHHGWFDQDEDERVVEMVNSSSADILLVCMGTPRQQFWVNSHVDLLRCPVIMTGGAYLDHLSVSVMYYPQWMTRARLNWLYRFCTEPRNVWKRYTTEIAVFGYWIVRDFVSHAIGSSSTRNCDD